MEETVLNTTPLRGLLSLY